MNTPVRNFHCPDELWDRANKVALKESYERGERVTVSDLIRRGLERECEKGEK